MTLPAFHEVRFPLDIALGARGGPERRTEIVTTATGREERNARWMHSRRKFDAGFGIKTIARLAEVVAFFEERRGRLYGFRFRDRLDWTSAPQNAAPTAFDMPIGTGDGTTATFQLIKTYGGTFAPYRREITKPVAGSLLVGVNGVAIPAAHFTLDATNGRLTFLPGRVPLAGQAITAGFSFDVPVRFDTDFLDVDLSAFEAGIIPQIPLIEIRV
jgi:uncharacterized protein (TIGR02217 family)